MFRLLLVSFAFQLSVGQIPGTPDNLRLTGSSETSISVAWNDSEVYLADRYIVAWSAIRPFTTPAVEVTIDTSNYTIDGLHEGTTYNVTVRSVNNAGSGFISGSEGIRSSPASEEFTTTATVPSSPPTAFTVTVLSDTSLRLNWRAPPVEDWNYLYLSRFYYCVVRRTSSNPFSSCGTSGSVSFQTDPNFDYSYEITGLQPLTEYLFSVRALNIQGYSPFTREISVTTTGNENGFFQLSFHSFFDCQEWIRDYGSSSSAFADLIYYIRSNCNCNFNGNGGMIDMYEESCRGGRNDKVVVRARLVAPTDSSLSRMLSLIEDWKSNTRSVLVGGQRLDIDLTCPTSLDSMNDVDCYNPAGAIAGGIIGSFFVIVLVAVVVVILVCVIRKCWWVKRKKSLLLTSHQVNAQVKSKYDSQSVRYVPKPQQSYKEPKTEKPPAPDPAQRQTIKAQNPTIPPRSYNTSTVPSGAVYYEETDDIDADLYECGDFGNEDDYEVAT